MILGIMSDTHFDKMNAIPHIIKEFKRRGVEHIIHCGDIEREHVRQSLFGGLPVTCALTEGQVGTESFRHCPQNWDFTVPGRRVVRIGQEGVYIGHKRAFEYVSGSEAQLEETLSVIRRDHDCVGWVFTGHTHHQIFIQGRVLDLINPGAVEQGLDGYEFAIVDSDTSTTTFSRIPKTDPITDPFSICVISDSFNISDLDPNFWKNFAQTMRAKGIKHIIHCGNISLKDIYHSELQDFEVHCYLRPDQGRDPLLNNWNLIPSDDPVVEIQGHRFCVQLNLGAKLFDSSESDMYRLSLELKQKFPEIGLVLCGLTNEAFLEEGEQLRIVNPGDVVRDRNYAIVTLPITEITFSRIPTEPLP